MKERSIPLSMTTPSEARRFMLSKVGREVILVGSHPKCGKRGTVDMVEEITDAKQLWFLTGATIPAEG